MSNELTIEEKMAFIYNKMPKYVYLTLAEITLISGCRFHQMEVLYLLHLLERENKIKIKKYPYKKAKFKAIK